MRVYASLVVILLMELSLSIEAYAVGNFNAGPYNISYNSSGFSPTAWTARAGHDPYNVTDNLGEKYLFYPVWINGGNNFAFIGIYGYNTFQDTDLLSAYILDSTTLQDFGFEELSSMSKTSIDGFPAVIVSGLNRNDEQGFAATYWLDNHTCVRIAGYSLERNGEKFIKSLHIRRENT